MRVVGHYDGRVELEAPSVIVHTVPKNYIPGI
jgi:hypothetical protein